MRVGISVLLRVASCASSGRPAHALLPTHALCCRRAAPRAGTRLTTCSRTPTCGACAAVGAVVHWALTGGQWELGSAVPDAHREPSPCLPPSPPPPCRRHLQPGGGLWKHFLRSGAFEGRGYRFTCPFDPFKAAPRTTKARSTKKRQTRQ